MKNLTVLHLSKKRDSNLKSKNATTTEKMIQYKSYDEWSLNSTDSKK